MLNDVLVGATAGAAGTAALNIATYADMAIRGRSSSDVPAEVVGELAHRAGVPLASGDGDDAQQKAQHRESGLGALSGYVIGLGLGGLYGVLRPRLGASGRLLAGVALGVGAMAASDVPATILGKTNPKSWGASGWASDVVPHLAYGLVTAAIYDAFARE